MFQNQSGWFAIADSVLVLEECSANASTEQEKSAIRDLQRHPSWNLVGGREIDVSFYRDSQVLEFVFQETRNAVDRRYSYCALYVVRTPKDVRILNGESPVIHELNGRQGDERLLDLSTEAQAAAYLDFFTTFVAGDEGPFFLIRTKEESLWPMQEGQEDLLDPFWEIARKAQDILEMNLPYLDLKREDLEAYKADSHAALADFAERTLAKEHAKLDPDGSKLANKIAQSGSEQERVTADDGVTTYQCQQTVWYGGHVFAAEFKVFLSGMVEMVSDNPIGELNHPIWELVRGTPLLARKVPRQPVSPREVLEVIDRQEGGVWRLENVRIEGDLDLSGRALECGVNLDDVQVTGSLILDDLTCSERILMNSVEVLERFSARHMVADSLEAQGLKVYGAFGIPRGGAGKETPKESLSFARAEIAKELALPRAIVRGSVNLRRLSCGGALELGGLRISPRTPFWRNLASSQEAPGLDLTEASVQGRLNLRVPLDVRSLGPFERTKVKGAVAMRHLQCAGGVELTGALMEPVPLMREIATDHVEDPLLAAVDEEDGVLGLAVVYSAFDKKVVVLNPLAVERNADQAIPVLDMSSSVIQGDLRCGAYQQKGEVFPFEARGGVRMARMACTGDVEFGASRIGVSVFWHGEEGNQVARFGYLSLDRAELGAFMAFSWQASQANQPTKLHLMQVVGALGLSKAKVARSLRLDGVQVEKDLQCNEARVGRNLEITDRVVTSRVGGNFRLERAYVGGQLLCEGLQVEGSMVANAASLGSVRMGLAPRGSGEEPRLPVRVSHFVSFNDVNVKQSVRLIGLQVGKSLSALDAKIGGDWSLASSNDGPAQPFIGADWEGEAEPPTFTVDLWGVRVGGDVFMVGLKTPGGVRLSGARAKEILFTRSKAKDVCEVGGSIQVDRCTVTNSISVAGILLGGDLNASFSSVGAMFDGNCFDGLRTAIGGDVVLSGADIGSDVRFCGARIGGALRAITGRFGRVRLHVAWQRGEGADSDSEVHLVPTECRSLEFSSASVEMMALWGMNILQHVELHRLSVSHDLKFFEEDWQGSLRKFDRAWAHALPERFEHWTRVTGEIKMDGLQIGGNLDISAALCEKVDIKQCEVRYNLQALRREGRPARARGVRIGQSLVHGDLEIQGLCVDQEVRVHRTVVEGRFTTASQGEELEAVRLHVTHTKAAYAAINVGKRPDKVHDSVIGDLDFKLMGSSNLSIEKTEVQSWHHIPGPADRGKYPVRQLMRLVAPFHRKSFILAERSLRRSGSDKHADKVYRLMRWRTLAEDRLGFLLKSRWTLVPVALLSLLFAPLAMLFPWSRGVFIGASTGFFTRSFLPILLSLAFLPITWSAALVPANVAPNTFRMAEQLSTADLIAVGTEELSSVGHAQSVRVPGLAPKELITRSDQPGPGEWNKENILRIMAGNHIPVIPFVDSPRWELADNRELKLRVPKHWAIGELESVQVVRQTEAGGKSQPSETQHRVVTVSWLSPGLYGLMVRILCWIAWPLFLIGLAADLQRHRDQTD